MTLQERYDARAKLVADARAILAKADEEKRSATAEEVARFDQIMADADAAKAEIEREERVAKIESELRESRSPHFRQSVSGAPAEFSAPTDSKDAEAQYGQAFRQFVRGGMECVAPEQRSLFRRGMSESEQRAFAAGTSNVGGYAVPQDFAARIEVAMKYYGGMVDVAEIIHTSEGRDMPWPTFNFTSVSATIVGEGAGATSDSSTPFGNVTMKAYTYRSPMLPVSVEFLQDQAFDESFIIDALGQSLGRGLNAHCTTGDGSGKPRGITIDATLGKTGTTGQTATVIYDDLVDIVHAVDRAYRNGGKCAYMMRDTTLAAVRKLKDSQNRPLWQPAIMAGQPDTLLGYPVVVNNDVAAMAASAKSILFGDFSRYKIRMAGQPTLLRLVERYADNLQVGFMVFQRADGKLLDAGTHPVVYYANAAS